LYREFVKEIQGLDSPFFLLHQQLAGVQLFPKAGSGVVAFNAWNLQVLDDCFMTTITVMVKYEFLVILQSVAVALDGHMAWGPWED
jgi:hypothetical protein